MLPSIFDSVKVYSHKGVLLESFDRPLSQELPAAWNKMFGLPTEQEDRNPASGNLQSTGEEKFHQKSNRFSKNVLKGDFKVFLTREGNWVLRSLDKERFEQGAYTLTVYRTVYDSDYKPAAYIESKVFLDSLKWAHLAMFQGVDFVVVDQNNVSIGESNKEFAALVPDSLKDWKGLERSSESRLMAKNIKLDDYSVNFFYSPLLSLNAETLAWVGVGISRQSQVFVQNRILLWIVLTTLLLGAIALTLALFLSKRLTDPIQHLVEAAEKVKRGNKVERLSREFESTKEIGYLIDRFDEMAMSVQAAKRTLELKLEELAHSNVQLTQAQDQLVESAKMSSLGQLVAGVAHELNNPIAFIYSNMIQMKQYLSDLQELNDYLVHVKDELSDDERQRLEQVLTDIEWDYVRGDMDDIVRSCLEGSVRVKDIVLGLRNFSRLDKGEVLEADINKALRDTAKLLSGQAKNKVEIDWELSEDSFVRCNISQVNQVFMNIMANAIQAIDSEGVVLVQTENVQHEGREFLKVSIQDSGSGMSPDTVAKIFDPFFTTKGVGEGTGLGLSIVYGIVQKHGGFIDVKSRQFPDPMHGSRFEIYLPKSGPQVDTDVHQAS